MNAIISDWYYLPKKYLSTQELDKLKSDLIITPSNYFQSDNPFAPKVDPKPIHFYKELNTFIGLPINYGMNKFPNISYEDRTVLGDTLIAPKRADPYHELAHEQQPRYISDLSKQVGTHFTVQAEAGTGTGKTVSALNVAADLGRKTLVIVNLTRLAHQWKEEAVTHLGLRPNQVGIIDKDYFQADRPLVIAVVNSIVNKVYSKELLDSFGTVIYDESHKYGSYYFSKCIGRFKAAYKIAQSATVDRKDDTKKIARYYFGPTRVRLVGTALPMTLYKVFYDEGYYPDYDLSSRNDRIKALVEDTARNAYFARLIHYAYTQGFNIFFVSERVAHIEAMLDLLRQLGIPNRELGQFTGYKNINGKKVTTSSTELKETIKSQVFRILGATYGMMTEGIDAPRYGIGFDLIPRSDPIGTEQLFGRVRRKYPGRVNSVWCTPIDGAFGSAESNLDSKLSKIGDRSITVKIFTGGKL